MQTNPGCIEYALYTQYVSTQPNSLNRSQQHVNVKLDTATSTIRYFVFTNWLFFSDRSKVRISTKLPRLKHHGLCCCTNLQKHFEIYTELVVKILILYGSIEFFPMVCLSHRQKETLKKASPQNASKVAKKSDLVALQPLQQSNIT